MGLYFPFPDWPQRPFFGESSGAEAERDADKSMIGVGSLISGAKIRQLVGESIGV